MIRLLSTLLLLVCLLVSSSSALAQGVPTNPQPPVDDIAQVNAQLPNNALFKTGQFGGKLKHCLDTHPGGGSKEEWHKHYSARFTYCMRFVLGEGTEYTLQAIASYMRPAMYAVIFLATVIMGMKAIGGMFRNTKVESTVFVAKVALVIIAFENMDGITALFYDITDKILVLMAAGASATFSTSSTSGFHCDLAMSAANYPKYEWVRIYDWMDCLILKVIGVGTNDEVKAGFMAVAGASLFSGTPGAHLAMMFTSFFIALGMFLLQVTTMLVMAYGAISMLMLMLPIFLLTVFFKVTENFFFQRWLSMVVRNMVQPAVMIGFLYFGLAALDVIMYKGSPGYYYKYTPPATTSLNPKPHTSFAWDSAPPSADHRQVVEPIHQVLNIKPTDPVGTQAKQLEELFYYEKLFDFEISTESAFYQYFDRRCGDAGVVNLATREITDAVMAKWDTFKQKFKYFFNDDQVAADDLKQGLNAPLDSDVFKAAADLACALGRAGANFKPLREYIEGKVNQKIPKVPLLELSGTDPAALASGEHPETVHERQMTKAIFALSAIFILAATFFTYTSHIQRLAASITGRMGMGLSVNSPSIGGKSLAKRIKTGMSGAEDKWTQAIKDGNASKVDKAVGAPIEGFMRGVVE